MAGEKTVDWKKEVESAKQASRAVDWKDLRQVWCRMVDSLEPAQLTDLERCVIRMLTDHAPADAQYRTLQRFHRRMHEFSTYGSDLLQERLIKYMCDTWRHPNWKRLGCSPHAWAEWCQHCETTLGDALTAHLAKLPAQVTSPHAKPALFKLLLDTLPPATTSAAATLLPKEAQLLKLLAAIDTQQLLNTIQELRAMDT